MSGDDVILFLKNSANRDVVSVRRTGLEDWKPASHIFNIEAATGSADTSTQVSSKRRYSLYGMYFGLSLILGDYFFEWRGPKFKPWIDNNIAENVGYVFAIVAIGVVLGFNVGGLVDFWRGRSRRKRVRDPGTFEEPEMIPGVPPGPNRRNNFIARYWRGEYSLGISFWLFGFLGNVAAGLLAIGIASLFGYNPHAIFGILICVWITTIAFMVWQVIGVWRSADRLTARRQAVGKRAGWATMAKLVVVLALLSLISSFFSSGLPQLIEISRMAFLNDPDIPDYSIRVMRNGTEAEISGGFKYGLADDFSRVLKASRQIKVVHLDSTGGRIGEAIRLNGLLKAQGVDTYVSNGCYSACTIAFAAGRNRFIRKDAVLGFHAPTFPGTTASELQDMSLDQRQIYIKAGFSKVFVDRALSTTSSEMWKPSADLLAAAAVITGLSNGAQFAVSGLGADVSKDRIAGILARTLPFLPALKDKFPNDYDQVVTAYYDAYVAGKTEADVSVNAFAKVRSILSALRRLADDTVLVEMGALIADQYVALGAKSPALCYEYISGTGTMDGIEEAMSAPLVDRQNEIDRRVIETASMRENPSKKVVSGIQKKLVVQVAAKGVGDDQLKLLSSNSVDPSRYGEHCRAAAIFYREIANLPLEEAGIFMRSVLTK